MLLCAADQTEESCCRQEVQKSPVLEVHPGPDPPSGGRHPGLRKLCKSLLSVDVTSTAVTVPIATLN